MLEMVHRTQKKEDSFPGRGSANPVLKRSFVRDCDVVAIRVRKTGSTRSSLDSWQIHSPEEDADSGRKRIFFVNPVEGFFFLFFFRFEKGKENRISSGSQNLWYKYVSVIFMLGLLSRFSSNFSRLWDLQRLLKG